MIQLILRSPDPRVDPLLASALRPECAVIPEPNKAQGVYDLIRRAADLNVFGPITGESGTGKELVK